MSREKSPTGGGQTFGQKRSILLAAFVLSASVLGMVACGQSDRGGLKVPTQVVPVKADPPGSPQTLAPLTPSQRRQAKRIIARNNRFRQIVHPHAYRLLRIIPWGTEDRRGPQPREVFIGTVAEAVLKTPKPVVVGDWPLWDDAQSKTPAYLRTTVHLTVKGLRSMAVYVDLKRQEVAAILPSKTDQVVFPPDYPTSLSELKRRNQRGD